MAEAAKAGGSVLVGVMIFAVASAWTAVEILAFPDSPAVPARVYERRAPEPAMAAAAVTPVSDTPAAAEPVVTQSPPEPQPVAETPVTPPAAHVAKRQLPRTTVAAKVPPPRKAVPVQARQPSQDELIKQAILKRLASNPRLEGRITVESKNAMVRLTGWTRTAAQARHAERDARSVRSVKQVRNDIRPRVGG